MTFSLQSSASGFKRSLTNWGAPLCSGSLAPPRQLGEGTTGDFLERGGTVLDQAAPVAPKHEDQDSSVSANRCRNRNVSASSSSLKTRRAVNKFFRMGGVFFFETLFTSKYIFDTKAVRPVFVQPEPGSRSQWSKSDLQFVQAGSDRDECGVVHMSSKPCGIPESSGS